MQNFIVLGIVPGTNLQLTFDFWLYTAVVLLIVPLMASLWRRRSSLRNYLAALLIARTINQYHY